MANNSDGKPENGDLKRFRKKVFTVLSIVSLFILVAALIFYGMNVILLIFSGLLLGIINRGFAGVLHKYLKIPYTLSLIISFLLILIVLALLVFLLGPGLYRDLKDIFANLPEVIERIRSDISHYAWGEDLIKRVENNARNFLEDTNIASRLTGVFSSALTSIINILLILIVAIYTAFDPYLYLDNFIKLFPQNKRNRIKEVSQDIATALRWWFLGRFASMIIIGIATVIGLWIMGIPLALTLGIIAAILTFIPNIGPFLAAIPAVLLGLMDSFMTAVYVALLYIGIQTVESYFITPMIQKKAVSLPPALLISFQVLMGIWLGAFGLLLATPILVVIIVLIQEFYIEDALGDDVTVLGESSDK